MLSGMHRNGRLFQSEVADRLRSLGIPVVPREPAWADRTIGAHVLELGSAVEIAELPDDVIMVSALEGGGWKLKDVFFDLDEAVDVAGGLYQRYEVSTFSPNRYSRVPRGGEGSFRTRSVEARRARQRPNSSSDEDVVLEAVKRAPKGDTGRRLIADVVDLSGLSHERVAAALLSLQDQGKVLLMHDDAVYMRTRGPGAREARRMIDTAVMVGGHPRHLVFLEESPQRRESRRKSPPAPRRARAPRHTDSPAEVVLEAVKRAPIKGDTGRRLIADVVELSGLSQDQVAQGLLELQDQGKVTLMRDDSVHMFKRGEAAREAKRMIDTEVMVGGHPRHLVFLENGTHRRNRGPVVKRDVEKSVGPSGYAHKQRVTVRAGLRVVPITEGSARGKFWLDEFPEEDFPRRSTLRHDAEHYGVVLEPYEVEA